MKARVRLLLLAALLTPALASAESNFNVHVQRWTNHDFPALLRGAVPIPPIPATEKRDGVMVFATLSSGEDTTSVEITVDYVDTDGQPQRQSKTVTLATTGCAPQPCKWAGIVFDIGKVDLSLVKASARKWSGQ